MILKSQQSACSELQQYRISKLAIYQSELVDNVDSWQLCMYVTVRPPICIPFLCVDPHRC